MEENTITGATAVVPQAPAAVEQPGETGKTVMVPLNVVEAVRGELSQSKAIIRDLQNKIQQQPVYAVPPVQHTQQDLPGAAAHVPDDPFVGMHDEDLVSASELRKVVQSLQASDSVEKTVRPIQDTLAKLQVQVQDPNYEQTIRTYLPDMLTASPFLRDMIMASPNPIHAALTLARMSPKYQAANPSNAGALAQKDVLSELQTIIENATKPGSPAGAGGGGFVSKVDYKTMSDAEFRAIVNRVKMGGG